MHVKQRSIQHKFALLELGKVEEIRNEVYLRRRFAAIVAMSARVVSGKVMSCSLASASINAGVRGVRSS